MATTEDLTPTATFQGSCFCNAIKFTLNTLPSASYICHCLDCRRFSGTSFAHNAFFPQTALTVTTKSTNNPESTEYTELDISPFTSEGSILSTFGDEKTGSQKFCSVCGTRLFLYCKATNTEMADKVIVVVGAIDGSHGDERLRPLSEGWCRRREVWMPDMRGTEVFKEW